MINQVVLVGRLTTDPDLRYTSNGTAAGSFTLAVNRNFTNQSGEREADFINCVIWRKAAENLANYAHKGTLIGITGRIQTRSYENKQGQRVYVTEVVAENFQLLESKSSSEQRNTSSGYSNTATKSNSYSDQKQPSQPSTGMPNFDRGQSNPFGADDSIDIPADNLPF